jgi:hypothetical protein
MISVAFALFVLLTPAFAQSPAIRVTVPFDFTVGKQTLAAGDYRVSLDDMGLLWVKDVGGAGSVAVWTNPIGDSPNQAPAPQLVFNRYGNHYFLAKVRMANRAGELFASSQELEYARTTHQERTTTLASRTDGK